MGHAGTVLLNMNVKFEVCSFDLLWAISI